MALKIGDAVVYIGGNKKGLDKTLDDVETTVPKRLSKVATAAKVAIAGIFVSVGAGIAYSVKQAINAVESENLFEVSLGKMQKQARDWSEKISKELRLNPFDVRKSMGTFDVMLKSMGVAEDKAYSMSAALTKLAYDMSSFYNLPTDVAFQKIRAGISGEIEPLKAIGVLINDDAVKAYALAHGIGKVTQASAADRKEIALLTKEYKAKKRELIEGNKVGDRARVLEIAHEKALLSIRKGVKNRAQRANEIDAENEKYKIRLASLRDSRKSTNEVSLALERLNQNYQKRVSNLTKEKSKLDDASKAAARFGLIMERTALAQGDKERTKNSPANLARDLISRLDAAADVIGTSLLPPLTKVLQLIHGWLDRNLVKAIKLITSGITKILDYSTKVKDKITGWYDKKGHAYVDKLVAGFKQIPKYLKQAKEYAKGFSGALKFLYEKVLTPIGHFAKKHPYIFSAAAGYIGAKKIGLIGGGSEGKEKAKNWTPEAGSATCCCSGAKSNNDGLIVSILKGVVDIAKKLLTIYTLWKAFKFLKGLPIISIPVASILGKIASLAASFTVVPAVTAAVAGLAAMCVPSIAEKFASWIDEKRNPESKYVPQKLDDSRMSKLAQQSDEQRRSYFKALQESDPDQYAKETRAYREWKKANQDKFDPMTGKYTGGESAKPQKKYSKTDAYLLRKKTEAALAMQEWNALPPEQKQARLNQNAAVANRSAWEAEYQRKRTAAMRGSGNEAREAERAAMRMTGKSVKDQMAASSMQVTVKGDLNFAGVQDLRQMQQALRREATANV